MKFRLQVSLVTLAMTTIAANLVPVRPLAQGLAGAPTAATVQAPTYYRDIQPIMAEHCISCHGRGRSAPFPLLSYQDARKRGPQITDIVASKMMPPWMPDSHGELFDENKLSDADIATIRRWTDAGMPAGTGKDLAASDHPGSGGGEAQSISASGTVNLTPSTPVSIAADSSDFYYCFVLPTHLKSDRYISAIRFNPGNTAVTDHAIIYLDAHRRVRQMNSVSPGSGFTITRSTNGLSPSMVIDGWGLSTVPRSFPKGAGLLVPKGSDIVLEVHYHATGKPEKDLPSISLDLCNQPPDQQVRVAPVLAPSIRIRTSYLQSVTGWRPVTSGISIFGVMPYMRSHGRSFSVVAISHDKSASDLLNIPAWNFNWVGNYRYKKPIHVSAGSILMISAQVGSKDVNTVVLPVPSIWGDKLDDEVAVAYVFYTTDREHLRRKLPMEGIPDLGGADVTAMNRMLLDMFDENKNGRLDRSEMNNMRKVFGRDVPSLSGMEM